MEYKVAGNGKKILIKYSTWVNVRSISHHCKSPHTVQKSHNNEKKFIILKNCLLQLKPKNHFQRQNNSETKKQPKNEKKLRVVAAISWKISSAGWQHNVLLLLLPLSLLLLVVLFHFISSHTHSYKANSLLYGFCSTINIVSWSNRFE